jgi:EF-P beta-lysylation protein EpmB
MISPWKQILRTNIRDWKELATLLQLTEEQCKRVSQPSRFPLNIPRRLANKIEPANLDDPILRQFLPLKEEEVETPGFTNDPVGDCLARSRDRLLHKYSGRLLIIASSACAMHCRYCFRREFDYASGVTDFEVELDYIRSDPSVSEVILSGGDPLSLSNAALGDLFAKVAAIPHVQRLRFHTRFPIGIPERIDDEFLQILENSRLQSWFVIHCNHPRELDNEVIASLKRVTSLGIPVLNQWVLLRGVNDDEETLLQLCLKLVDNGFVPYYLHQLDRVAGAAHFEVAEERGIELIRHLERHLPGYGLPRYVREVTGGSSKNPIFPTSDRLALIREG